MKIFIPSYDRPEDIITPNILGDLDYLVVVHNYDQYYQYVDAGKVDISRLVVSGVKTDKYGLTRQREWIVRELVSPDEWFVFLDDDVHHIDCLPFPYYEWEEIPESDKPMDRYSKKWYRLHHNRADPEMLEYVFEEMMHKAEDIGTECAGFRSVDNYFYARKKWHYVGWVLGGTMLLKNTKRLRFRHDITMEDYALTARAHILYGCVLVNQWCYAKAKYYTEGGMGLYEDRIADRKRDVQKLQREFPGFFRPKKLKWQEPGTDLSIKVNSRTVSRWRQTMRRPRDIVERTPL